MAEAKEQAAGAAAATQAAEGGSLIDQAIAVTEQSSDRSRAEGLIKALIGEALKGTLTFDKNVNRSVNQAIKRLDAAVSEQLAAIMHHPDFQKLEGSWRGLKYLVFNSETCESLKVRVMNITKRELFKDLDTAVEFDQSQTFKKMYEDEFGMPGGEPFGALIGDYEFTNSNEDVDLLQKMSQVSAAAFCPFISAAAPQLFDLKSYTELATPRDLARAFQAPEYIKWKSFRESEDSRYVSLVMPRVLARLPYGSQTVSIDEFGYEEVPLEASGKAKKVPHENYCWMNASYAFGAQLTQAFAKTNWCTAIRGRENGGSVEGLPVHFFASDAGDTKVKCPTEIAITDRRDAELSKLGFIPLCYYKNTDYAVFFGAQTTQKPKQYDNKAATANAAISARLPYIMASSRIAHFLKMIARDKIGSFMEASDCEKWLNKWISQYVLDDPTAKAEMKAKFPLKEAKIIVKEMPGKPGSYRAEALLRPWLQLEELTTSLSMVAEIPKE
jgi:type VI secretion system protein ImpC